ncbi:MAG: Nif3-like dinuclear metal center hexameric protein, partial [Saprospiraceae bacterium]|nr:Nif3-like dinuclear metal center hexameric protein [Saprospiraceae bacterium]
SSLELGGSGHLHSSLGVNGSAAAARVECHIPAHQTFNLISKLHDLDEKIRYETLPVDLGNPYIGAGLIGNLPKPVAESVFLAQLKRKLRTECIRYTALRNRRVRKVAVCGGSGSFLLNKAIEAGADVFITGDFKYHEFFDADKKLVIADVGHFESEQFTIELLQEIIKGKFRTFACYCTEVNTNPVHYL